MFKQNYCIPVQPGNRRINVFPVYYLSVDVSFSIKYNEVEYDKVSVTGGCCIFPPVTDGSVLLESVDFSFQLVPE